MRRTSARVKYLPAPEPVQALRGDFAGLDRADRPDGAAVLARIDVCLRMPAGERVTVRLRSRSSRRASVVEANVTMDGVAVLNQTWAGHDTITETT
jgi:hypothetical protein